MKKESVLMGILMFCVSLSDLSNTYVGKQRYIALVQGESTSVSGHISENITWTLEGSPYIIVGRVIVETDALLIIEPGVVVKFTAGTDLVIDGGLVAQGNATHKIAFTSNATAPAPGDWNGTLIRSPGYCNMANSIIEYATIGLNFESSGTQEITHSRVVSNIVGIRIYRDALGAINGVTIERNTDCGIYVEAGNLEIQNSSISNNNIGVKAKALGLLSKAVIRSIEYCTISNNTCDGFFDSSEGEAFLWVTCTIRDLLNSDIMGNGGYGINNKEGELLNCRNTRISNNGGGGVNGGYETNIHGCSITNNKGYGVYGRPCRVYDCNITNNKRYGVGGGVITVLHSHISNNSDGVAAYQANIQHSTIINNRNYGVKARHGKIWFNDIHDNGTYDIYVAAGGWDIDAKYNWWGTTNGTLIRERRHTKVSYVPFLNSSAHTLCSLTIDPIFYDITGTTLIQPSSWSLRLGEYGTVVNFSSPVTYNQTRIDEYSIVSIIWKGVEVLERAARPTIVLTSDMLWSPSFNCRLPTRLAISLSSSTFYPIYAEINGNLTCNEVGLSGASILLSYMVAGGESWHEITVVNSGFDGGYLAVWMPSATGNYLVRARWAGNSTYPGSTVMINLVVIPFKTQNIFSVASNSTISELAFNSTSRELSFTVTGPSNETGYGNVHIAKTFVENIADVKVYLDCDQISYTATSLDDSWLLHFTYLHNTHKVTISLSSISLPFIETTFGKSIIFGVSLTAIAILILFVLRKKHRKKLIPCVVLV